MDNDKMSFEQLVQQANEELPKFSEPSGRTYETIVLQRDTGKRYFKPVITPITFENMQVDGLELKERPRTEHAIFEDIYIALEEYLEKSPYK